jgi:hypothetical protein
MAASRPSKLTIKQKAFAHLVGMGLPKNASYDQVYGHHGGKRGTRDVSAMKLSQRPAVAAEIDRQFQHRLNRDLQAEIDDMLGNMKELAFGSPDDRVRVAATKVLYKWLERRRDREVAAGGEGQVWLPRQPKADPEKLVNELLQMRDSQRSQQIDLVPVSDELRFRDDTSSP